MARAGGESEPDPEAGHGPGAANAAPGPSGELNQREGPGPAGRDPEGLPSGRGGELLQAVVAVCAMEELLLKVLRGLGGAHASEEVGRRHVDQELQLELGAARREAGLARVGGEGGYVHAVKAGAVGADVHRGAIRRARYLLKCRLVADAGLAVEGGVDRRVAGGEDAGAVLGASRGRGGALEGIADEGRAAAVGELVGVAGGGYAVGGAELVGAEHVLAALGEGLSIRPPRVLAGQVVKLVQVFDVVREVGDGAVVEVIARVGVGEPGRGVPGR